MSSSSPSAGGVLIALGAMLGTAIGLVASQPTIGFLIGTGIGIAAALLIWWKGR